MKLQTQIPLNKATNPIDYQSRILLIGSCFVENIGQKLNYFMFKTLQNPFGILFHPKAIENLIEQSIKEIDYTEDELFFYNERWHCFDAHSNLSDASKENLLKQLNLGLATTRQQINHATHIVITLGTSWVYRNIKTGKIVANCHKIPQSEFKKELLSVNTVLNCLQNCVDAIRSVNKKVQILCTVSPVRHLKDGFVENQRSKSHLIAAIHEITKQHSVVYFPSYEIMMDELRDYRFYATDMIHPSSLAVDYIWEKFKLTWISEHEFSIVNKVEAVQKELEHRPFNPNSEQHKKFVKSLEKKIAYLQQAYPFMRFKT